jgi:polar amino acid transport system substrate-binding protein
VDLARYLARQLLGTKGKLQLVPIQAGNRLTFLLSDLVDMLIAAVTDTGDRTSVYAFSDPYFISGSLLLVPRGSPIKDLLHVRGKKVAVIGGSIQQEGLEPVVPEAAQVQFASASEAVAALRAGRVDAFAEDDLLILTLAKRYPDLIAVGKPFQPHPFAIAMRRGDKKLRAWVNEQLRKAKADGTYERLWNKYFGNMGAILARR